MSYPPREFPNLPSFEESCDLWSAELDRSLPGHRRVLLAAMVLLGLALMVLLPDALQTVVLQLQNGEQVTLSVPLLSFLLGAVLVWAPIVYLPWVFVQMPPRPTRQHYQDTLALMRAYHTMKAETQ